MNCNELLDVAIVGGGPAGAVAAKVLAGDGFRVALFDASTLYTQRVGEHLPPRAARLLQRMHLESALDRQRQCCGIQAVWGSERPDERSYLFEPYGAGWHLDRVRFDQSLRKLARESGAWVRCGTKLLDGRFDNGVWRLSFRTSDAGGSFNISARFCIDATGRTARIARRCGGTQHHYDRMVGLIQKFERNQGSHALSSRVLVEATATGWWFSAPVTGHECICCFFTDDRAELRQLACRKAEGIVDKGTFTARRLAGYTPIGRPMAKPATTSRLAPACTDTWLAIGDAVMAMDPLSSHGIATAISTGFYGARATVDLLQGRHDAAATYSMILDEIFADYATRIKNMYASESRFTNYNFWLGRHRAMACAIAHPFSFPLPPHPFPYSSDPVDLAFVG